MTLYGFILFPAVGALIGALTNHIAIKMLFRPYDPVFIGKWKVPFTPGLIPRQRTEIARNIACTFERNLLSGEDLHAVMTGPEVEARIEAKVDEFFADLSRMPLIGGMVSSFKPKVLAKIVEAVEDVATKAIADGGDLHIGSKIEARINQMDIAQVEELVLGFSREQFRYITIFGGILGALIGLLQAGLNLALHV